MGSSLTTQSDSSSNTISDTSDSNLKLNFDTDPPLEWSQIKHMESRNSCLQYSPPKLTEYIRSQNARKARREIINRTQVSNIWTQNVPTNMSKMGQDYVTQIQHVSKDNTQNDISHKYIQTQNISTKRAQNKQTILTERNRAFQIQTTDTYGWNTDKTQSRQNIIQHVKNTTSTESTDNVITEKTENTFIVDKNLLPNKWSLNKTPCAVFKINDEYFVERKDDGKEYIEFEVVLVTDSEDTNVDNEVFQAKYNKEHYGRENQENKQINKANYVMDFDDVEGSFQNFLNFNNHTPNAQNMTSNSCLSEYGSGDSNESDTYFKSYSMHATETIEFHSVIPTESIYESDNNNDINDSKRYTTKAMEAPTIPRAIRGETKYESDNENGNGLGGLARVSRISYASVASKPAIKVPERLSINLNGRQFEIDYYSWNMVLRLKANKYYCMACKEEGSVRFTTHHCTSDTHTQNLQMCRILEKHEDYLIRKVDDKYYHCAHCNNLQLIHGVSDHLEAMHPKKTIHRKDINNKVENEPTIDVSRKHSGSNDNINDDEVASRKLLDSNEILDDNCNKHIRSVNFKQNADVANNNICDERHDIYGNNDVGNGYNEIGDSELIIQLFGFNMKVSVFAYNVIFANQFGYVCGLCLTELAKNQVTQHVNSEQHIRNLNGRVFDEDFGFNLFRHISDSMHCTLCHEMMPKLDWLLIKHVTENHHVSLLNKALDKNPSIQPKLFKTQYVNPIKTDMRSDTSTEVKSSDTILLQTGLNHGELNQLHQSKDNLKIDMHQEKVPSKKVTNEVNSTQNNVDVNQTNLNERRLNYANENVLESSVVDDFDTEEHIIVKITTNFVKISLAAFNSLVATGDGNRYCFVCSQVIYNLKSHVDSDRHLENMNKCKFIDVYDMNLIRQKSITYHCSICNVLITKSYLQKHLSWPIHVENESLKNTKKPATMTLKNYEVLTTKEVECDQKEPTIKVLMICDKLIKKKFKIVKFDNNVLAFTRDAWEGIYENKSGYRCIMCQMVLNGEELSSHRKVQAHCEKLECSFELQYLPAVIRKVNKSAVNCLICNTEVTNTNKAVFKHIRGKKHTKKQAECILKSSQIDLHLDFEDVFTIR